MTATRDLLGHPIPEKPPAPLLPAVPKEKWPVPPAAERVHIVDVDIPFGSMCALVFKWMLATIVAGVPIGLVMAVLYYMAH